MSVIGLRVGPFEIVETASVPEPGDWYLARRTGMSRRSPSEVLVKMVAQDADESERTALQQEYENLRELEDPRIPAPIAYYEGNGALAIASVEGAALSEVVEARHTGQVLMTPATLLDICLELAETLQHLHHRGRHHGHLSPHCVLLAPNGKLWLFGVGRVEAEPPEAWLAPERARGRAASAATDQWSLGALAVSLITGNPPWNEDDPRAQARVGDPEPIIGPVQTQWPALARVLRQTLEPNPENRYANINALRQQLLSLSRRAGGTSERREIGARMARARAAEEAEIPVQFAALPGQTHPPAPQRSEPEATPEPPVSPEAEADVDDEEAETLSDEELQAVKEKVRSTSLPEEPLPVVRPDVDEDIPEARRSASEEPAPERGEEPEQVQEPELASFSEVERDEEADSIPDLPVPEPEKDVRPTDAAVAEAVAAAKEDLAPGSDAGEPSEDAEIQEEPDVEPADQPSEDESAQEQSPSPLPEEPGPLDPLAGHDNPDVEPSEATVLFSQDMLGEAAAAFGTDEGEDEDDSEEEVVADPDSQLEEKTVLFDQTMLENAAEAMLDPDLGEATAGDVGDLGSNSAESDEVVIQEAKRVGDEDPELGDLDVDEDEDEITSPSTVVSIAPWLAMGMVILLVIWAVVMFT